MREGAINIQWPYVCRFRAIRMGFRLKAVLWPTVAPLATALACTACGSSSITTTAPSAPKCQVSVTNSPSSASADGSTGTIAIETTRDCTWVAVSSASWIAITSTVQGQGSGDVTYRVAPNGDPAPRHAVVSVNDAEVTVAQDAALCHLSVAFSDAAVPSGGGTITVSVTASAPACTWAAGTNVAWIGGSTGSQAGNGTATFTVLPNLGSARTGSVTVAGQSFTILQQGVGCDATLTPTSASLDSAGGTVAVQVTVPSGCAWTKSSPVDWITVSDGGTANGPGVVNVTVAANSTPTSRQTALVIANRSFTITQSTAASPSPQPPGPTPVPPSCGYSLGSASLTVDAAGGAGAVTVTTASGCQWSATPNVAWLSIMGGSSGTGAGTVSFSAAANSTTGPRTGTLTIAGQTFTVTQVAAACAFSISPTSQPVPAAGGTGSIAVTTTSGCAWSAMSNVAWLSITGGSSGAGAGTVSFSAAANSTTGPRTGTLTIAGQTFTVTQVAAACAFSISPTSQPVPAAGGTGSTAVTTTSGCAWSASADVGWLSITGASSGTGAGKVSFSAAANSTTGPRMGTLTIAGETFTVTQAANKK
jgi:hypothetical protein